MRRRAFLAFALVGVIAIVWFVLQPGGGSDRAGGKGGKGGGAGGSPGTVVPGQNPIEHVVFIVKENRTFNNYFATYGNGAAGSIPGSVRRLTPLRNQRRPGSSLLRFSISAPSLRAT